LFLDFAAHPTSEFIGSTVLLLIGSYKLQELTIFFIFFGGKFEPKRDDIFYSNLELNLSFDDAACMLSTVQQEKGVWYIPLKICS
jgi:hypothetical protein